MSDTLSEIKTQIDDVLADQQVTQEELAKLRRSINCLSPNMAEGIQRYIHEKTQIGTDTREKLLNLLQECRLTTEAVPEVLPPTLDGVFRGARSEVFSPSSRRDIAEKIEKALGLSDHAFITPARRENISIAITDRLIHDPDFQGILSTGVNFAEIANHIVSGARSVTSEETTATGPGSAKAQARSLDERIAAALGRAIEPIQAGLKGKHLRAETALILDNPKALASYAGWPVNSEVTALDEKSLRAYITGLNAEVLTIDKKVFPLETIKERGMEFLANGPGFLVDFFKWILKELPFLGNIIAKFLGYRDAEDADRGLDEELRQCKSLSILREFGRIKGEDGKEKDGKYSGKLDLLKGRDLSGVNRKKLKDFFAFTNTVRVDATTPDFWIALFQAGKVTGKDADGQPDVYELSEKITAKDFEDDYKGLYEKLNKLSLEPANREWKRKQGQKRAQATQEEATRVAQVPPKTPSAPTQPAVPTPAKPDPNGTRVAIDGDINLYSQEIGGASVEWTLPAIAAPAAPTITAAPPVAAPMVTKSPEVTPAERLAKLSEAFMSAMSFPFTAGNETVDFKEGWLHVGDQQFKLEGMKWGWSENITDISFDRAYVVLGRGKDTSQVPREEIVKGFWAMLTMPIAATPIIAKWQDGELRISRVA